MKYKIKYKDNITCYSLNRVFKTELSAWKYIENNGFNEGYQFYDVVPYKNRGKNG
mgnify:CR=1 FL=1